MSNALAMEAVTVTYLDVKNLIYDTCHKFKRRYGGNIEELIDCANYFFVLAYHSHDAAKSSFTTYLRFKIWHGLR